MRFRRVVLLTHRWIGLASSAVLAVVGLTGVVLLLPETFTVRRVAGPLHSHLALGWRGAWIVYVATAAAVFLQIGGLVLWWKRKTVRVSMQRGWVQALDDLHHAMGAVTLPLMVLLAATGLVMPYGTPDQPLRRLIGMLHTAGPFSLLIKLLYAGGSAAFAVQGLTGILMWWKPGRRLARRLPA